MDYTPDTTAQADKKKEIETYLATLGEGSARLTTAQIGQVIDSFVSLQPPLRPPNLMTFTVMANLGRGGAQSRKPGNIVLNWRRLFDLVPDVTLASAGAAEANWLVPFAALYVWTKLWRAATVKIEENDAFILYSLWAHRNDEDKISEDEGFSKTNQLAAKHGMPPIEREAFDRSVTKLSSIDCVELETGVIWLREWVKINY